MLCNFLHSLIKLSITIIARAPDNIIRRSQESSTLKLPKKIIGSREPLKGWVNKHWYHNLWVRWRNTFVWFENSENNQYGFCLQIASAMEDLLFRDLDVDSTPVWWMFCDFLVFWYL